MMLTPLPVTFTGMCTGIWVLLPETMPGELVAEPSAEVSAMAAPAPARTTPLVAAVSTASFLRFIGFLLATARFGARGGGSVCYYSGHCGVPVRPGRLGSAFRQCRLRARSRRGRHVQPNEPCPRRGTDAVC